MGRGRPNMDTEDIFNSGYSSGRDQPPRDVGHASAAAAGEGDWYLSCAQATLHPMLRRTDTTGHNQLWRTRPPTTESARRSKDHHGGLPDLVLQFHCIRNEESITVRARQVGPDGPSGQAGGGAVSAGEAVLGAEAEDRAAGEARGRATRRRGEAPPGGTRLLEEDQRPVEGTTRGHYRAEEVNTIIVVMLFVTYF